MQAFSNRKKIQETEGLIKESLLRQLSYSIKEIQLSQSSATEVFSTGEGCNSLIVILEAIFLHGLKRGILRSALKTVSGSDDRKPQPSFWNMACNYTHRDTIARIRNLTQITTDVGRSRAWIRLGLNEGELTSYIAAMEKDRRALNSCYSNHAFLRDRETCDTACKFLEGILAVDFDVPVNSSILNTWSSEPLILSGLWSPPMKTPVGAAVDVAERIEDDDLDDTASIKTTSSITTLSTIMTMDETQALKMILEIPFKMASSEYTASSPPQREPYQEDIAEEEEKQVADSKTLEEDVSRTPEEDTQFVPGTAGRGNSLRNAPGWSSPSEPVEPKPQVQHECARTHDQKIDQDYNSLLEKAGISPGLKVNYENRLRDMMEKQMSKQSERLKKLSDDESNFDNSYTSKLYRIVREIGLKAQKYTCSNCKVSIGLTFGEARLCHFTGEYYCVDCHVNDTQVIPSRIIFNWDHKKYPVCTRASQYLTDICNRFLIDIKKVNPKLYSAVPEMKDLRIARIQLHMLRAYLYTCKDSLLGELQKRVTPREHLYEFIDHYSIRDLCQVPGGSLLSELNSIVAFGRSHVTNCWLCSQKGFICEICKNAKVIYPFDISSTYRCGNCSATYHDTCLTSSKNCPKCLRIKSRSRTEDAAHKTEPLEQN